jgi:hypothetical protein
MAQASAASAITGAGLAVGTITTVCSNTIAAGNVTSSNPVAGTSVAPGTSVNLVVSTGPCPVTVPDVVNMAQASAESDMTGAGLAVGTIATACSDTIASGNVISSNPVAGNSVASGTPVNLVVSTGACPVNVVSIQAYDSQDNITLESFSGTTLKNCQALDNPSPADTPSGIDFPYGLFSFTIESVTPGGSTTMTITLPDGANPGTYYKYGPTPDDPSNHWYEFMYDGETGAEINGNLVTLHFVDGKRGDSDLDETNGTVIDPGGPVTNTVDYGGSRNCFIGSVIQ